MVMGISEIEDKINKAMTKGFAKSTSLNLQGSLATKTMIDPRFNKEHNKNEISLDISLSFEPDHHDFSIDNALQLKKLVQNGIIDHFGKEKVQFEEIEDTLKFTIAKIIDKKEYILNFEFRVYTLSTSGNKAKQVNFKKKHLTTNDVSALIDNFNAINSG
jgi:hypothetical protein